MKRYNRTKISYIARLVIQQFVILMCCSIIFNRVDASSAIQKDQDHPKRTTVYTVESLRMFYHSESGKRLHKRHVDTRIEENPSEHLDSFQLEIIASQQHPTDSPIILSMDLERNHHLIHPNFEIFNPVGTGSHSDLINCYYVGHVQGYGTEKSFVALNTCQRRLDGVLHIDDRGTFEFRHDSSSNQHVLNAISSTVDIRSHSIDDYGGQSIRNDSVAKHVLKRRALPNNALFLEWLLCNDYNRVQSLGKSVESQTLQLANLVAAKYRQVSFGRPVFISVVGIYNAPRPMWMPQNSQSVDAGALLSDFGQWRQQQMSSVANRNTALGQNDGAQLITGRDMTMNGQPAVTGLAVLGGLCDSRGGSASVAEGRGDQGLLAIAQTMAHELGHTFNIPHDGQDSASGCSSASPTIMTPVFCSNCDNIGRLQFSTCSQMIAQQFLNSGGGDRCLKNQPQRLATCGNGRVDADQGEECDDGQNGNNGGCCDMNTCRLKPAGQKCQLPTVSSTTSPLLSDIKSGVCSANGKCAGICGNGKLDLFEDCDPQLHSNGCCNPDTCKFMEAGQKCRSGVCDGADRCINTQTPYSLKRLPKPQITRSLVDQKKRTASVNISRPAYSESGKASESGTNNNDRNRNGNTLRSQSTSKTEYRYTLDGSMPSWSSPRVNGTDLKLTMADLERLRKEYNSRIQNTLSNMANVGISPSQSARIKESTRNIYAPDQNGDLKVQLRLRAFEPGQLLSDPIEKELVFKSAEAASSESDNNANNGNNGDGTGGSGGGGGNLGSSGNDINQYSIGSDGKLQTNNGSFVFGIILAAIGIPLFVMVAFYRSRDEPTRERWRSVAESKSEGGLNSCKKGFAFLSAGLTAFPRRIRNWRTNGVVKQSSTMGGKSTKCLATRQVLKRRESGRPTLEIEIKNGWISAAPNSKALSTKRKIFPHSPPIKESDLTAASKSTNLHPIPGRPMRSDHHNHQTGSEREGKEEVEIAGEIDIGTELPVLPISPIRFEQKIRPDATVHFYPPVSRQFSPDETDPPTPISK